MASDMTAPLPLDGVRVLDLTDGAGTLTTRLLADLGADVVRAETADGSTARRTQPVVNGVSVFDEYRNANKRSVLVDSRTLEDHRFNALVSWADICVQDYAERAGESPIEELLDLNPQLVAGVLTPFGLKGPGRDWTLDEWTLQALGGLLSGSGKPGHPPVLAPGAIALSSAATQAAWPVLLAYYNRMESGVGDLVDVSLLESVIAAVDPGFGITGTASAAAESDAPRGRADNSFKYPIFACADGYVRICVLAVRQWKGMFSWMGEPEEFASSEFDKLLVRFASATLLPAIGEFFADKTRAQLTDQGQKFGVPVQGLLTLDEVLETEHFLVRGALRDIVGPTSTLRLPDGLVVLNGRRAGLRMPAPGLGEHTEEVMAEVSAAARTVSMAAPGADRRRPLEGLRVLDLGVIVFGAEVGRLLADQGAEVVKVESRNFPDGSRASRGRPDLMTPPFARGHRGKLGLGINLRTPDGVALFKDFVRTADVVLSNFKPGTMDSLGIGYDDLRGINANLIYAEGSALGARGPWSRNMGYGPLVRAATGISSLWTFPDPVDGFADAGTIYPDHVAARVEALAVLAGLVGRRRGQTGVSIEVAQSETILCHLAEALGAEAMAEGEGALWAQIGERDAPRGLFPCAGNDEWCVVTVSGGEMFQRLCRTIGRDDLASDERFTTAADRYEHREVLEHALVRWIRERRPREAMTVLQEASVTAGMMLRQSEHPGFEPLIKRAFFGELHQPQLGGPIIAEQGLAGFRNVAPIELRPAPEVAEHSRDVVRRWLGYDEAEIERLLDIGALEDHVLPSVSSGGVGGPADTRANQAGSHSHNARAQKEKVL